MKASLAKFGLDSLKVVHEGVIDNFTLIKTFTKDYFALDYSGYINIFLQMEFILFILIPMTAAFIYWR